MRPSSESPLISIGRMSGLDVLRVIRRISITVSLAYALCIQDFKSKCRDKELADNAVGDLHLAARRWITGTSTWHAGLEATVEGDSADRIDYSSTQSRARVEERDTNYFAINVLRIGRASTTQFLAKLTWLALGGDPAARGVGHRG